MQSAARRAVIVVIVVAGLFGCGCGDFVERVRARLGGEAAHGDKATAKRPGPTMVAFEMVAGVTVFVDEREMGRTPLAAFELSAGGHEVRLEHRCGKVIELIDLAAGETTTFTDTTFGLETATLRLTLSASHGQTLAPTVRLAEADSLEAQQEAEHVVVDDAVTVLACRQRLKIGSGHADVGGYWEDITFVAGQTVSRTIVLRPGPDMVRLPGGDFVKGMRPEDLALVEEDDEDYPPSAVKLAAFELDRTPVTAGQWTACRVAGGCKSTEFDTFGMPDPKHEIYCSTDPYNGRPVKKGATEHPMNCAARVEAERYCEWAGKRLPSIDEYEYAARSGRSDWKCPWGSGAGLMCDRREGQAAAGDPEQVCAYPSDNSSQGLCDLAWLSELVADPRPPGQRHCDDFSVPHSPSEREGPFMYGGLAPWIVPDCMRHSEYSAGVTFRCARDVSPP